MSESAQHKPDYSNIDAMPTEDLKAILRLDAQLESGGIDQELVLHIMEVVSEREKEEGAYQPDDAQNAYARFMQHYYPNRDDYDLLYEDSDGSPVASSQKSRPQMRRWLNIAAAVAIVITVLAGASMTASALGYDIWGAVASWTDDIFRFTSQDPAPTDDRTLSDVQNALTQEGVTLELIPTWLPEGYVAEPVIISGTPQAKIFTIIHKNGEKRIRFVIQYLTDGSKAQYEKSSGNVEIFEFAGIQHYIYENNSRTQAGWVIENCECSLAGDISVEEMKQIIKSIYK